MGPTLRVECTGLGSHNAIVFTLELEQARGLPIADSVPQQCPVCLLQNAQAQLSSELHAERRARAAETKALRAGLDALSRELAPLLVMKTWWEETVALEEALSTIDAVGIEAMG